MASSNAVIASDFVVVGGGVAGVSCCQHLAESSPDLSITLVAPKDVVKVVTSHNKITRALEEVLVEERPTFAISEKYPGIKVLRDSVADIDHKNKTVKTAKGCFLQYRKICLCTGAKPNLIDFHNENIIGIRDVDSVAILQKKLKNADRILIVGNGGIALELVYELIGCEVIWAIKDDAIGNVFLDKAAAEFLLPSLTTDLNESCQQRKTDTIIFKRKKYAVERENSENDACDKNVKLIGGALGPDWSLNVDLKGKDSPGPRRKVQIEYCCEVKKVFTAEEYHESNVDCCEPNKILCTRKDWPQYVMLTNGKVYGTDLIISATGVSPNLDFNVIDGKMDLSEDGGILVDGNMRTSLADIYAAGDICRTSWPASPHWFQMRLWTQAFQMGVFAAQCMLLNLKNEEASLDFCFELFAHVTSFFGHKLCLLGTYNAQGLGTDYELLVRYTPGVEYVKVVLQNGKMMGALLLGETDLEETFENLILNGMDLSRFGDDLLDPNIEIDEFFD